MPFDSRDELRAIDREIAANPHDHAFRDWLLGLKVRLIQAARCRG